MLELMQKNFCSQVNNTFELMETSRFAKGCEPTLHVGVTGRFNVNIIFSISEQKYVSMMRANQWSGVNDKGSKSTLSQLDLTKSQYDGIVEESIDCMIALYLKIKRRVLRGRRRCKTL
jgi:hypothetical protein